MSKPSTSGGSAGLSKASRWRISRGLDDRSVFPPEEQAGICALACELPAKQGLPLSRFSLTELIQVAQESDLVRSLSRTTLWRWLNEHAIRPWRHRSWIFPRDPEFFEKAGPVLDLYQGVWEGVPLGPDDFVICADEKTSIQARGRTCSLQPPRPGHAMRVEHEYIRHGALACLAALDVKSGTVIERIESKTGIHPFMRLVRQVMRREPYRKARRVFWIVDNGSSHRPDTFPDRLREAFPNAIAVHLPIHASWLNQVELFFSILQRKLLTPNHFESLLALAAAIADFIRRYNRTAKPFRWTFTRAELRQRLRALA